MIKKLLSLTYLNKSNFMKKVLIAGVLGFSLYGCAVSPELQHSPEPLAQVTQIIDIEGQNKDKLFESSKIWMAKVFKSSNNVVQYADKESGSIIGKGSFQFPCEGFIDCGAFGNDRVNFTIKIDTKDNKARLSFSDITRTPLTYVKGGLNANMGKDLPITQVKQKQQVSTKFGFIIEQYRKDVVTQQSDTNW